MDTIYALAAKFLSGGDPAHVTAGTDGCRYGLYQLAGKNGSIEALLDFAEKYDDGALRNYGRALSRYKIDSDSFIREWKSIGTLEPVGFSEVQNAYAKTVYYDTAVDALCNVGYDAAAKSAAMRAVLFSRSLRHGYGNMVRLYTEAAKRLGKEYLDDVDDQYFDREMIASIYDFLLEEFDHAGSVSGGSSRSNGIWTIGRREGCGRYLAAERAEALSLF